LAAAQDAESVDRQQVYDPARVTTGARPSLQASLEVFSGILPVMAIRFRVDGGIRC
jgi:hypothetical protein